MKRALLVILGIIFLIFGLGLASAGTFLAVAGGTEGQISTPAGSAAGEGHALVFNDFAIDTGNVEATRAVELAAGARSLNGKEVFIGYASTSDVLAYLGGVNRDVVSDISSGSAQVTPLPGVQLPAPPQSQGIWLVSAQGMAPTIALPSTSVPSTLVIMNADASAAVSAELTVGVDSPRIFGFAIGAIVGGVILVLLSIWLFVRAKKAKATGPPPFPNQVPPPPPAAPNGQSFDANQGQPPLPPPPPSPPQNPQG